MAELLDLLHCGSDELFSVILLHVVDHPLESGQPFLGSLFFVVAFLLPYTLH